MKSTKDIVREIKDDSLTGAELTLEHYTLDVVDKVVTLLRGDFAQGLRCAYRINRDPLVTVERDGWEGYVEQVSEYGIYRKYFEINLDRTVSFNHDIEELYADSEYPDDYDAFAKEDFTEDVLETLGRGEFDKMLADYLDAGRYDKQLARGRL